MKSDQLSFAKHYKNPNRRLGNRIASCMILIGSALRLIKQAAGTYSAT